MKYLMSWTYRVGGTAKENEESVERALALFSKWSPSQAVTFHQFLQRIDGSGGFAVVECDNAADLADATTKFSTFAEYLIYPVIDVEESIGMLQQACAFRESVG